MGGTSDRRAVERPLLARRRLQSDPCPPAHRLARVEKMKSHLAGAVVRVPQRARAQSPAERRRVLTP